MTTRLAVATALLLVLALPAQAASKQAAAPAKEPGELWETKVQMTGMGMAMPAQTLAGLPPHGLALERTAAADEKSECEIYDVKSAPGRLSWAMRCKGALAVTGHGHG